MEGPTHYLSPNKTSFLFSNSSRFCAFLPRRIDAVLHHESSETGTHRPRCQQSATLRRVPAVIYKVPSVSVPRGMRSSSRLAWGNSDMEKSLSLIILRHKSHSRAAVLLTCVHFLPHNDQTQLQPAALRLYLSTHLGASGLCLLRYWRSHSLPLLLTLCHFHLPAALSFHFSPALRPPRPLSLRPRPL